MFWPFWCCITKLCGRLRLAGNNWMCRLWLYSITTTAGCGVVWYGMVWCAENPSQCYQSMNKNNPLYQWCETSRTVELKPIPPPSLVVNEKIRPVTKFIFSPKVGITPPVEAVLEIQASDRRNCMSESGCGSRCNFPSLCWNQCNESVWRTDLLYVERCTIHQGHVGHFAA